MSPKRNVETSINCAACGCKIYKTVCQNSPDSGAYKSEVCAKCSAGIQVVASAFEGSIACYRVTAATVSTVTDIQEFVKITAPTIIQLLATQQKTHRRIKTNFELFCTLTNVCGTDEADSCISDTRQFNSHYRVVTRSTELQEICAEFAVTLEMKLNEFQEQTADCEIENIHYVDVHICNFTFPIGTCYINLPQDIKAKNAVVNIRNCDDASFAWSIVSALCPARHDPTLVTNYPPYRNFLNLEGIDFPVTLDSIPKFERQNDISVNVYQLSYDTRKREHRLTGPLYYSQAKKPIHVNLLYLYEDLKFHYCHIKNMEKLIRSTTRYDGPEMHYCDGCLLPFRSKERLQAHQSSGCNLVSTTLPSDRADKLKFLRRDRSEKIPFVIYADSESIIKPVQRCRESSEAVQPAVDTQHVALSFAYYIKCAYSETLSKYESCRGPDCAKFFIKQLVKDAQNIYTCLKRDKNLSQRYKNTNIKIPVFFHNMAKYDLHQFIKALSFDDNRIQIVPENLENYVSVSKFIPVGASDEGKKLYVELQFLDSYRFERQSLEKLVQSMSPQQLKVTRKMFPNAAQFELMRRKGVFPYSYVDAFETLTETTLPSKEMFYDKLNHADISEKDYRHAWEVWSVFGCETLAEYSDLYLKSDVVLLTDVFENYRDLCMKTFDLDPCHYISASGFSWDTVLKYSDVELDYLVDSEMINFIRKGLRGDIAFCSKRCARANNKYMHEDDLIEYDPKGDISYLVHWDVNNAIGWALAQDLPVGNFHWLSELELESFDVQRVPDNSSIGYILEVDLKYEKDLHYEHNDLPFCPDTIVPPAAASKKKKLIPNLYDKSKYVIYYRNLKQVLQNGLRLLKIHRVLRFNQSDWMKKYVEHMLNLADSAKSTFEKQFYDAVLHSLHSKLTCSNESFPNIRLATTWTSYDKHRSCRNLISQPSFHRCSIFAENLVAVEVKNVEVSHWKPLYLGFCISELLKWLVYDFHYNFIKKTYGNDAKLLYIESDSLIYKINTEDVYEDMFRNYDRFDVTSYEPRRHSGNYSVSIQDLSLMRDSKAGKVISYFIGFKPKMYAYNIDGKLIKKAGYVKKSIIDEMNMESYIDVLEGKDRLVVKQTELTSKNHCIYSKTVNRVALTSVYDNRLVINDEGQTYAWGHYAIDDLYYIYKK